MQETLEQIARHIAETANRQTPGWQQAHLDVTFGAGSLQCSATSSLSVDSASTEASSEELDVDIAVLGSLWVDVRLELEQQSSAALEGLRFVLTPDGEFEVDLSYSTD